MFKLVLIDDDAEVLAINQKYLTGAGFTVYTAISPRCRQYLFCDTSCKILTIMIHFFTSAPVFPML